MENIKIVSCDNDIKLVDNRLKTEYLPKQSTNYHTFNLYLYSTTSETSYYYGQIFISKDYTKIIRTCSLMGTDKIIITQLIDFLKKLETL